PDAGGDGPDGDDRDRARHPHPRPWRELSAASMTRLRLFPLRMVLFPGMALPLQVFEERYRTLVAECLAAREPFGVALIREGTEVGGAAAPFSVGCTARIQRVSPTRDGRLAVTAVGERRFRIVQTYEDRP